MDLYLLSLYQTRPQAVTDEGIDNTNLAYFYRDYEDLVLGSSWPGYWQQQNPWAARQFIEEPIDNTNLKYFYLEQEESAPWCGLPFGNAVQTIPWMDLTFLDEASDTSTLAYFYLEYETAWPQLTQTITWLPRPSLDEGIDTTSLAFLQFQDDDAWPQLTQAITWTPRPFLDEAIDSTSLAFLQFQDDDAWPQLTQAITWTARPFLDEGVDNTSLKYFYTDLEDWVTPASWSVAQFQANPWTARTFADEDSFVSSMGVDDEAAWPQLSQAISWLPRPFLDEGVDNTSLKYFYTDLEDWTLPASWSIAQLQVNPWTARTFLDEDPLVPAIFVDDEWTPIVPQQSITWLQRPFLDEGIDSTSLAYFYTDLEDWTLPSSWSVALVQANPWTARAFLDEDPLVPAIFVDDEASWPQLTQAISWLQRPFLDEGIDSTSLAFFQIQQDDAWPQAVQSITWVARPALDDDLYPTAATIFDDEQLPFVAVQSTPWTARPALDEDPGTQLSFFYLEYEDLPPSLQQTIIWSARPFADEDAWPTYTLEDEVAWIAQVQAISWLPRPFADEDPGVGFTNFFIDDDPAPFVPVQSILWLARPFLDEGVDTTKFLSPIVQIISVLWSPSTPITVTWSPSTPITFKWSP